jgi:hypothetical protein
VGGGEEEIGVEDWQEEELGDGQTEPMRSQNKEDFQERGQEEF